MSFGFSFGFNTQMRLPSKCFGAKRINDGFLIAASKTRARENRKNSSDEKNTTQSQSQSTKLRGRHENKTHKKGKDASRRKGKEGKNWDLGAGTDRQTSIITCSFRGLCAHTERDARHHKQLSLFRSLPLHTSFYCR